MQTTLEKRKKKKKYKTFENKNELKSKQITCNIQKLEYNEKKRDDEKM